MNMKEEIIVNVIGAGLAGCEAAYQLTKQGIKVKLYEMKPIKKSPAHSSNDFAELVCSNSLRANGLTNAVGILKEEMRMLDSLIIRIADETKVPAGGALAVDREKFSRRITEEITNNPLIEVVHEEITEVPTEGYNVIATGPLTSDSLSESLKEFIGQDYFYFYDAAAPIIDFESIDMDKAYFKSRYDKGEADYINCPMSEDEFEVFYNELINADVVKPASFEREIFFEGCMPFEEIARRGKQTLLFGPMKPVGLNDPKTDKRPFAVVQLRQDNAAKSLYNIVGFQTHLKWGEQKRIISLIPGLENAVITRYGVMHRNTFINSPTLLNEHYQYRTNNKLVFVGQMTGVEGYVESAASGLVGGLNLGKNILGKESVDFKLETIIGSMAKYVSNPNLTALQPMNANFGLLPELGYKHKKKERKELYGKRALELMQEIIERNDL